ncbi:hypothetical protein [Endozoicomonas acroporae]|uniref:hypothetical protein n=1 Tax=Endozoicomonas acroporae TaxID=1701104 RepID=UPI003D7B4662
MAIYTHNETFLQSISLVTVSLRRPSVFLFSEGNCLFALSFLKNQIVEKISPPLLPGAIPSVATQTRNSRQLDAWQGGALSFAYIAGSWRLLQAEGASYGMEPWTGEGLPPLLFGGFRREQGHQVTLLGTSLKIRGADDVKRFFPQGRFVSHHQCPTTNQPKTYKGWTKEQIETAEKNGEHIPAVVYIRYLNGQHDGIQKQGINPWIN